MADVKSSPSGHLGLFATETYKTGDTILSELHPLMQLAPTSDKESSSIQTEWSSDNDSSTGMLWESIVVPDSTARPGTFKGMVQAGILWMKRAVNTGDTTQQKILKLYRPDKEKRSEEEKSVLDMSEQAMVYLKAHAAKSKATIFSTFDDWETLQKVLLVWACNSFEGGRIYDMISRINHSCNPNAVVVPTGDDGNGQRIVAATAITAGTEITISYLGLLLYADKAMRRRHLAATKYFLCQCSRCQEEHEGAAQIPCPSHHPRHPTQMCLDEDVQYDDDKEVQYVSFGQKKSKDGSIEGGERLQKVLTSVATKIESFLQTYQSLKSKNGDTKSNPDTTAQDEDENDALLEEHVSLASTMMGRKHWTTNLTLLLHLDLRLSSMSKKMLTTQELPEMEEVAEAIDSLQRLYEYVDSLQLELDPGHVLGDVTIGVARTLVSLGDEKSQKYGSEWLGKIDTYVETFGDEGLQKVVAALKGAWKKHERSDGDDEKPSKKLKVS